MNDADKFATKMLKASDAYQQEVKDGVNRAAKALQAVAMANVDAATGGDGERRLSGVKSSRATVGVQAKPARSVTNPTALVQGFPAGLFTIVEKGARPHMVGAGKSKHGFAMDLQTRRLRRVTRKGNLGGPVKQKLLALPTANGFEGPRYGPFIVSGSRGKEPLARAANSVAPEVARLIHHGTGRAFLSAGFK